MAIGRNDPCWCGSDRKYKNCHLDRDRQTPPTFEEVQQAVRRSYSTKVCLHPDAPRGCEAVIGAHSIQRSGVLDRIARDGHVYVLRAIAGGPPDFGFAVKERLVGIREASTFNGFCARHDDELFAPIEKHGFEINGESALLLGFRSLCYGYYQTVAGLRALEVFSLLDRGTEPDVQAKWQSAVKERRKLAKSAIAIAEAQLAEMGDRMRRRDFRGLHYYGLEFPKPVTIAASFGWHPKHDFEERPPDVPEGGLPSDLLLWSALPIRRRSCPTSGPTRSRWPSGGPPGD